jgi:16S rRNA (cytidine1402-2'-O)-methyltransferase
MNKFYVVPTPIGNIGDITQRAIEAINNSKFIICEDTRVTKKLFDILKINYSEKKFLAFFSGQEKKRFIEAVTFIESGDTALLSDSGTPTINDPGHILVKFIRENRSKDIELEVLPGANASIVALVSSGMPTDRFLYLGFLPTKDNQIEKLFGELTEIDRILPQTFIAYESVHRILKTIQSIDRYFGEEIKLAICRELTKKYEQVITGSPQEILKMIEGGKIEQKGEFVLVMRIENKKSSDKNRSF